MQWVEIVVTRIKVNLNSLILTLFGSKAYLILAKANTDFREDPELNALGTPSGFRNHIAYYTKNAKSTQCGLKKLSVHMVVQVRINSRSGFNLVTLINVSIPKCVTEEFRSTYTVQGREPVYINPKDAKKKGIKDGDLVRVFNDRGQLLAGAGTGCDPN